MKFFFSVLLFLLVSGLFPSAPLESGYTLAPGASAAPEERIKAYADIRSRVINAAIRYENVPYRYGGVTSAGLDCSGLVYLSFKDAIGVNLPRTASGLYSWAEKITLDKVQPGDLLFFKTDSTGKISHVALYLGGGRFIHSASAGPRTGVIYSTLDERYWARTYAGAGRAFPETPGYQTYTDSLSGSRGGAQPVMQPVTEAHSKTNIQFLAGAAFAPSWNGFLNNGGLLRGFTSQLRFAADIQLFKLRMLPGMELRPEYDSALGVFRLPLTLSWGFNDKIRIFAGPVLSFGDASITADGGERHYTGGTSLLGTAGITAAPFIFSTSKGQFAPYFEAAWQSYSSSDSTNNFNMDFYAGFRFSTGLRWTMQINR